MNIALPPIVAPFERALPEDVGLSGERLDRLTGVLRQLVASARLPGAVGLVARRGRIAWHETLGVLDPAGDAPMTSDAIFRIYSMTKPIVSVATMMLFEEGRLMLSDPVSAHLPEYAGQRVAIERDGAIALVAPEREATIQDLLRHTAGLTYAFLGTTAVQQMYLAANLVDRRRTNAEFSNRLAGLPLCAAPGTRWEYSHATDVLGRLVEVVSGQTLGAFVAQRITGPLNMSDTAFAVPEAQHHRVAEPFARDPDTGADVRLFDPRRRPALESGGGGLVGTALDYARFLQMMLDRGTLGGRRLLGRKTVELMTSDHLGPIPGTCDLLPAGHGFGLGFAVRTAPGVATMPGSVGQYYWGGIAGTTFWVDPAEELFAILMVQAPGQRDYFRPLFRNLVYAALAD